MLRVASSYPPSPSGSFLTYPCFAIVVRVSAGQYGPSRVTNWLQGRQPNLRRAFSEMTRSFHHPYATLTTSCHGCIFPPPILGDFQVCILLRISRVHSVGRCGKADNKAVADAVRII